jgi:adenylate kinase family enzyme
VRIHVTGASGAGTTTLGRALARALSCPHFDSDAYYWMPTRPRFRVKRPVEERRALLLGAVAPHASWVLSGSLVSWGQPVVPLFDLVIYLRVPTGVRLRRLRAREEERQSRNPDRSREEFERDREEFLAWAAGYDTGGLDTRSAARHDAWLRTLACPVTRLEGELSVEECVRHILVSPRSPLTPGSAPDDAAGGARSPA